MFASRSLLVQLAVLACLAGLAMSTAPLEKRQDSADVQPRVFFCDVCKRLAAGIREELTLAREKLAEMLAQCDSQADAADCKRQCAEIEAAFKGVDRAPAQLCQRANFCK